MVHTARSDLPIERLTDSRASSGALPLPELQVLGRLLAAPEPGSRALVLVPTRELAAQISAEIQGMARCTSIRVATAPWPCRAICPRGSANGP